MTRAKISRMQYFFLIPNLLFGKAIGITAGVVTRKIGGDTWIAMSIGFTAGILVMLGMSYLCSKFPEKTILQFTEAIAGKWPARMAGVILTSFFAVAFAASANVMTLHLKEYFLLETPFSVICLAYLLLCMYGVFLGIEVIVRFGLIGFLGCLMITLTMITGTMGDFNLINLLPLLDRGAASDLAGSIYVFSDLAMAILAVGMLYPMLNNKENAYSLSFWAMMAGFLLVIIWPIFEVGVMGTGAMKQYVVVCMQQIRCAQLTRYLPRYELIMVSFFTFGTFVQSAVMYFCSVYSFKQTFSIQKDRCLIPALGFFLFPATYLMAYDHNNYIYFLTYPWPQIFTILCVGIIFLLLLIALFRGKLKQNQMSNDEVQA